MANLELLFGVFVLTFLLLEELKMAGGRVFSRHVEGLGVLGLGRDRVLLHASAQLQGSLILSRCSRPRINQTQAVR